MNFHWKSLISGWCSQGHEQRGRPSAWRETGLHATRIHEATGEDSFLAEPSWGESLSWIPWQNSWGAACNNVQPAWLCMLCLGDVHKCHNDMLKFKVKQLGAPRMAPFSWVLMIDIDEEIVSTWNQDHLRFSDGEVSSQNVHIESHQYEFN